MQKHLLKILSIGTFKFMNGYVFAINAMKELKDEGISFKYTIIGGDPTEEILFSIKDLGLEGDISILDHNELANLNDHFENSDVLLVSYLHHESTDVVLKAMSSEMIVITTGCLGIIDIVKNGENGFVVPIMDAKAIANTLIRIDSLDDMNRELIREQAKKTVETLTTQLEVAHNNKLASR